MPRVVNDSSVETMRLVPKSESVGNANPYQCVGLSDAHGINSSGVAEDTHREYSSSDMAKSILFGGFDGLLASLSLVAGAAGGNISVQTVLIIGGAITLASAMVKGANEFLSSRAHCQYMEGARRREMWEFKHFRACEMQQMTNRFVSRGMPRKDAEGVVSKLSEYESLFVGLMVVEELGYKVPDNENRLKDGTDAVLMFTSFAACGMIPFVILWLGIECNLSSESVYGFSVAFSIITLFLISLVKSTLSTASLLHVCSESFVLGLACAAASYGVASMCLQISQEFN